MEKLEIYTVANQQFSEMTEIWMNKNQEEINAIAPGAEILEAIFATYGLKYNKVKDEPRIAQLMDDVPSEIKMVFTTLIQKPVSV